MHQVTPDEFRVFQGNLAFWFSRLFPSGRKSDRILRKAEDPAVGDSDFVGIASQIFDGIAKAVKGFFDVRAPVFFIKAVFEFFPVIRITQFFTGGRKSKGAAFVKGGKQRHIFPLELIPQDCHRNKKFTGGFTDLSIPCQPAAGNNAVHVYMVAEFLVPGMEDLDNAGCRPEIFLIRRQFQKRSGTASVKKPVEELLITVNQGIEFMGKGKYHMEVRGIDDLSPALIHPDFLLHSLAVRAVTVTAGIIMDFHVSTVRTLAQIETKPAGFTVYNGMGGFPLYIHQVMPLCRIVIKGMFKYLPDFVITHGIYLP